MRNIYLDFNSYTTKTYIFNFTQYIFVNVFLTKNTVTLTTKYGTEIQTDSGFAGRFLF